MKSKDLYVKFSSHMTLISDFIEENLALLYKAKTFSEKDKTQVETKLDEIMAKNSTAYDDLWVKIESDLDSLKREIVAKIDSSKELLRSRHERSKEKTEGFYSDLKQRVKDSKTRDLGLEMEQLKEKVRRNEIDSLEVVGDIGNKINTDVQQIQSLNREFAKTEDFVEFIYKQYLEVRSNTLPAYCSLDKQLTHLVERIDHLTDPAIRTLLEDARQDLDALLARYERLIQEHPEAAQRAKLMHGYLKAADRVRHTEEPLASTRRPLEKKSSLAPRDLDRKQQAASERQALEHQSLRERSSKHAVSAISNASLRASNISAVQNPDSQDLAGEASNEPETATFDGALCPLYSDADFSLIKKFGVLPMSQFESKDFIPVVHLYNNCFLLSSFQKKEGINPPTFGFKINFIPDSETADMSQIMPLFSSDSIFLSNSKIAHLLVLERDSDGLTLIVVNTEDGTIYLFNFVLSEEQECIIELETTISKPKASDWAITSMKKFGRTDYLVCTNNKGEILVYDTCRAEILSIEKRTRPSPRLRRRDILGLLRARKRLLPRRLGQRGRQHERQFADFPERQSGQGQERLRDRRAELQVQGPREEGARRPLRRAGRRLGQREELHADLLGRRVGRLDDQGLELRAQRTHHDHRVFRSLHADLHQPHRPATRLPR